jgi:hypothetical protein
MKKIILISSILFLSGCASTPVKLIAPEYKVVKVPDELYNCPIEKQFPKSSKLTNEQVGQVILKLQKNNMTCKNSLDSIHQYLEEAEAKTSKKK